MPSSRPDEIADIDGVDLIPGSEEKFRLFDFVETFEKKELSCIYVSPTEELNEINIRLSLLRLIAGQELS